MFKKIIALMLIFALSLSACGETECLHEWVDATCEAPKTCSLCGITEGEPLSHSWTEATYESPKTCFSCGATEGDPLEKPKYSEEEILASGAVTENQHKLDFLVGSDKKLEYDAENGILHFILTPSSGAADAYAVRGDNWGLYTMYLKMVSSDFQFALADAGYDVPFRITLLDDRDTSKIIYEVENQVVLTDVYADIVPESLKTNAAVSAFYTVYHNYDNQYEITAEYSQGEGGILYFFIKLDTATSTLFNYMSNAEIKESAVWSSLTDSVTRWSSENTNAFVSEGHNVLVVYMLLDGTTVEDAYFAVANGTVIYNAFEQ